MPSCCKILMAAIVQPAELGKLNTFVALLEAVIPLAFVPVFDQVRKNSSTFLLMSACFFYLPLDVIMG